MIKSFKHKGLKRFHQNGDGSFLPPDMLGRLHELLTTLDASKTVEGMSQPSYKLHPLKGTRKGYRSVKVRANWRMIFRFEGSHAFDVNFVDYH